MTTYGEATPEDVKLGLEVSIKNNRIKPTAPLAIAIGEYIAQTMNGSSVQDALNKVEIPISVVQKLGSLGQEESTRRKLLPLDADFNRGE